MVMTIVGCDDKTSFHVMIYFQIAHCEWDDFGEWGACSATCDGGKQERSRSILVNETLGGNPCVGNTLQSRTCNSFPCPSKNDIYINKGRKF